MKTLRAMHLAIISRGDDCWLNRKYLPELTGGVGCDDCDSWDGCESLVEFVLAFDLTSDDIITDNENQSSQLLKCIPSITIR